MKAESAAYVAKIREIISRIETEEKASIAEGARMLARSIESGGLIHVFGTGHSHIFAEEAFFRAGGLACINPVLEPSLMLHTGAVKSSVLENQSGFAKAVFEHFDPQPPDSLVLFSNSGVNAVPVEFALLARARGIPTIGIGSKRYITYLKQEKGKQSITEFCDVFIDNKGEVGDASVEVEALGEKIGPTSTIAGVLILQLLLIETVSELVEKQVIPPIFVSGNLPGGKEKNRELIQRYRKLVRML